MLASGRGVRSEGLVRRLALVPPDPMAIGIACLGLLGLTTSLDSMVQLLGLDDVGALADIRRAIDPLDTGQRAMFALLIGVGPGFTEELFFRGYLLNRIAATQSTAVALVVSSVVFGAFHFDPVHTPLATAMGFYLGLCMLHTRSLWVPIAAHTANNALATATTGWYPSDAQAVLLIPLGAVAAGSAITMLARGRPLLPRGATVW
jgi:membrane protease YdiL (CAAX protease family)